ncbi:helicase-related protein, partial [Dietzia sp.]|uniref:helicase-related protein n=1 Tax=Dietzia sp. TaxID=1871616 RepID=UPI002FD94B7E
MPTEFVFDDAADDPIDTSASAVSIARIGSELPAAALVPELREALGSRGSAVVSAPPGSGKTTIVPPVVAAAFAGEPGRVVVTQPRRIAARAAAHRLAELTGTKVGELAGFTVRGERRVSAGTSIEFCTPGVLLRRLLADPGLEGACAVICDEVHERQLDTDLVLGMLVELRELRPELGLVAMSATVDAPRFASLLGGSRPVPVLDSPAVPHELEVSYAPPPGPRQDGRGVTDDYCRHVASLAARSLAEHPGDALVFLPGAREIERVAGHLGPLLSVGGSAGGSAGNSADTAAATSTEVEILRLHGSLPPREQDAALRPAADGRRRVVLSTAVAESSLTVPGVRIVIDSCLSREPRLDSARGVSGLVTVSSSQDSANQRAGRAARTADGV